MSDTREMVGLVKVAQAAQRGMITLRGDLSDAGFAKALGHAVPAQGTCDGTAAWMSPDELLIMCPHGEVTAKIEALKQALKGHHHLVQDVSDARAVFQIKGAAVRDVIAKLCPVDMRPAKFGPGKFRRTRIAQVPCAFWMVDEETIELVAFTSVADYVWGVLTNAADSKAPVGYFA